MKNLLFSAAAVALLASVSAASAQQDYDHRIGQGAQQGGQHDVQHGAPAHDDHTAAPNRPAAPPADHGGLNTQGRAILLPGGANANHGSNNQAQAPNNQPPNNQRPDNRGPDNHASGNRGDDNHGFDNRGPNNNASHGSSNNNGRNTHPNYSQYHRDFNAPRRYRFSGTYHNPPGYYAHRWTYGQFLPRIFFAQNDWIDDYDDYGLVTPPPGTVWVRYGADALLIDEYTGEVIQVEYSIFY